MVRFPGFFPGAHCVKRVAVLPSQIVLSRRLLMTEVNSGGCPSRTAVGILGTGQKLPCAPAPRLSF